MDYNELSEKLVQTLNLDKEPVAIKIYGNVDDVKDVLPKYDGQARHCTITYEIATTGKSCYATADEMNCPNGQLALGLVDQRIESIPQIIPLKEAIAYSPLKDAEFEPDTIIIYVMPVQALKIAQLYRVSFNKRFEANFNGVASLCADAVAIPYNTGKSNMTLGCRGSRKFSDIKDEEMVMALKLSDLEVMMEKA